MQVHENTPTRCDFAIESAAEYDDLIAQLQAIRGTKVRVTLERQATPRDLLHTMREALRVRRSI